MQNKEDEIINSLEQREIKEHIKTIVKKKTLTLDNKYQKEKEKYVNDRKKEVKKKIRAIINPIIKQGKFLALKANNDFKKNGIKIKWSESYNSETKEYDPEIKVLDIKVDDAFDENKYVEPLQHEFDKKYKGKYSKSKELIEEKQQNIIETMLFSKRKELYKMLKELKAVKV